ncbi:MAG: hypothetical protein IID41_04980 [Planctomycetes bacterium]|nr:hypothetical protein [Planctomycetota bacterium]MCH8965262.1 hypothetical protein [Planctomycetota bacterium]
MNRLFGGLGTAYSGLALFALIHLLILLGVVGYAYQTGRIDRTKIEQISAIIRGDPPDGSEAVPEGPDVTPEVDGQAESSEDLIEQAMKQDEMERLQRERALADIRNLDLLLDRRMAKLQRDQEAHEQRVARQNEQVNKRRENEKNAARQETIKTIGSMAPKRARDFLMNLSEADAVKILLTLPGRKRKGILEACKTPEQTRWRDKVLSAMLTQPAGARESQT